MKIGTLFGVPIRVHPLLPLMAVLAISLGQGAQAGMLALMLVVHEASHVAAARLLGVRVSELELMPFGGAARMEALWTLRPGQIIGVSLAGPMSNLVMLVLSAALGEWNALGGYWVYLLMRCNLMLMGFNMLPALPLDGGRVLCGLLSLRIPQERAVNIGVRMGQALAALLALAAAYGIMKGHVNLTLVLSALYLFSASGRERQQASGCALRSLLDREAELQCEGCLPIRWLAARADTPVRQVTRRFGARYVHMVWVMDSGMKPLGTLSERALLQAMLQDGNLQVSALLPQDARTRRAQEEFSAQ